MRALTLAVFAIGVAVPAGVSSWAADRMPSMSPDLTLLPVAISQAGPQCSIGTQCRSVGAKVEQYNASVESHISPGIGASEAAAKAYCIANVIAEVSRVCADELQSAGQSECAAAAYQQRDAALATARQSEESSRALSSGDWKANCGW